MKQRAREVGRPLQCYQLWSNDQAYGSISHPSHHRLLKSMYHFLRFFIHAFMYFGQNHLPPSLQFHPYPYHFSLSTSCVLFWFLTTEFTEGCLMCMAIEPSTGTVVNLSGTTSLDKTDSPSLSSHQLPVAPWVGVKLQAGVLAGLSSRRSVQAVTACQV